MSAQKKTPEPVHKSKADSLHKAKAPESKPADFAFGRQNYKLLLVGLGLIFLGFLLMIGGGSDDPNVFNYQIFSFRRLTLAPLLILAGFVVEIFAIMRKPKDG
jgi:hypothetical protein